MSRLALRSLGFVALAALLAGTVAGFEPHMDPSVLPVGCPTCHRGHGEPGSPMLPTPQKNLCLSCHGTQGEVDRQIARGTLTSSNRPTRLGPALDQPFVHPVSDSAFSRHESGAVTCTSCHSPHRSYAAAPVADEREPATKRMSPRDPTRFEYQMCQGCHGQEGATTLDPLDISRLFNPNSRSYHPVEAPAPEHAPSTLPSIAGREISCTDCHGNSDTKGPRGPHGSAVRFLLKASYAGSDGSPESAATYRLCYRCHDREMLIDSSIFPEHGRHIVEERAACTTCHNPHGSVDNRALIRFGEETTLAGVAPSDSTGRLAYESSAPGSGACYLTCHGVDHAPAVYGGATADALAIPQEPSAGERPLREGRLGRWPGR